MRAAILIVLLTACAQQLGSAEQAIGTTHAMADPKCACKYAAGDPNVVILEDNCPTANVCADATCKVRVTRGDETTDETLPCETLSPTGCSTDADCPGTHACFGGECVKKCDTHADCAEPDYKCFWTGPAQGKLCLLEGAHKCTSIVHEGRCYSLLNAFAPHTDDDCLPTSSVGGQYGDQHDNHGANNYYCKVMHSVKRCVWNDEALRCELVDDEQPCFGSYYE